MKGRIYTQGITIFTTLLMYREVKDESDRLEISLSEFFRGIIRDYFNRRQLDHQEKEVATYELRDK